MNRVNISEINSSDCELRFGFNYKITIIYSIRRIDNPFIPLFFHWSGQHILFQLAETLKIHDCYIIELWITTHISDMDRKSCYFPSAGNSRYRPYWPEIKIYEILAISPVENTGLIMAVQKHFLHATRACPFISEILKENYQ